MDRAEAEQKRSHTRCLGLRDALPLSGLLVVMTALFAAGVGEPPAVFAQEAPGGPPTYTATAVMLVRMHSEGEGMDFGGSRIMLERLLTGRRLMEKLALDLRMTDGLPPDRNAAAEEWNRRYEALRRNLRVKFLDHNETVSLVAVSFTSDRAGRAAEVANRATDAPRDLVEEHHINAAERRRRVLLNRAREVGMKVIEQVRAVQQLLEDRQDLALYSADTMRERHLKLLSDVEAARREQSEAKALMAELEKLKRSLEAWRAKQPPSSRQPVGGVLPDVALEMESARAKAKHEAATAELARLEERLSAHQKRAVSFAKDQEAYLSLLRRGDTLARIEASILEQAEESETAAELWRPTITVIEAAKVPTEPDKVKKP